MITVRDIARAMEDYAPQALAEEWDNVGLLAGSFGAEVKTILVALDADNDTISEAIDANADLIVTHHPLLRLPINRVTDDTFVGAMMMRIISNGISLFAAHTNLDTAEGGVNDALAKKLELYNIENLYAEGFGGYTRKGEIKKQTLGEFSSFVKKALNSAVIKCTGDKDKIIKTVGVCGGSGGGMIEGAKLTGVDALVVGEAKYGEEQLSSYLGLALIEAGHFETENLVCEAVAERLSNAFGNVKILISKRKKTYYE